MNDGGLKGQVKRTFTTTPYKFDFEFDVSPYQGVAIDTVFQMWVKKSQDSLMDCQFGYENDLGELRIDVN